jgi:PTH1 family peptidyl-tRNA hydrolase
VPGLRLVVGLGNPGERYARTRHNAGIRLVELLGGGANWKNFEGLGEYAKQGGLLLAKPLTYMNESGQFVGLFARFHKILPEETLICFDDIAIELGRLKIRTSGSSGGQKGMKSVLETFKTQDVARLRIGVGLKPEGVDAANFVLSPFSRSEEKILEQALERARLAVETAVKDGLPAAMNLFNAKPEQLK